MRGRIVNKMKYICFNFYRIYILLGKRNSYYEINCVIIVVIYVLKKKYKELEKYKLDLIKLGRLRNIFLRKYYLN